MRALLLIDLQNDFCPGGSLPVPQGDEVMEVANNLMPKFSLVVATKDWHPPGHVSFASTHGMKVGEVIEVNGIKQILWPEHCIQGSKGAEFHPNLNAKNISQVIYKGTEPTIDSYSGFFDNARQKKTGLDDFLRSKQVDTLYVMGLATDYCVKYTVLDGLSLGYKVYVIIDGCRGVNVRPQDEELAIKEMQTKGALLIKSGEV